MSEVWTPLIAVALPVIAGAAGGVAKYTSLRARALRAIDAEIVTLNSLPADLPAYGEMEAVVRRHVGEYARAVTRDGSGISRSQVWSMNVGVLIGLVCTVGGGSGISYIVYQLGRGPLNPLYVAVLLLFVLGTAFGVLMLTLVIMRAFSRASAVAWAELTAE